MLRCEILSQKKIKKLQKPKQIIFFLEFNTENKIFLLQIYSIFIALLYFKHRNDFLLYYYFQKKVECILIFNCLSFFCFILFYLFIF